jgi:hypothetical protein
VDDGGVLPLDDIRVKGQQAFAEKRPPAFTGR